jgi:hypothetical protein
MSAQFFVNFVLKLNWPLGICGQHKREGKGGEKTGKQRRFGFGLLNLNISANVCCLEDITLILECLLHGRHSDAVKQQHCNNYTITDTVCRM